MPFPAPNRREDNHGRRPYPRQGKVPKHLHFLNLGGSRSAGGDFRGWSTERDKGPDKWHCAVPRPQRPKRGGRGGGGRKARGRGGKGWPRRQEPQKGVSSLLLYITEIVRITSEIDKVNSFPQSPFPEYQQLCVIFAVMLSSVF